MIPFMSNMLLNYNGSSCKRGFFFLNTMWYGLMGVSVNSRMQALGFSYQGTTIPRFVHSSQLVPNDLELFHYWP